MYNNEFSISNFEEEKIVNCLLPDVKVYLAEETKMIDPFKAAEIFRGDECFDGTLTGWRRWQKPSPESKSDTTLQQIVINTIHAQTEQLCALHDRLLYGILAKIPQKKPIVFVSILRAGVFVALGLARRMVYQELKSAPVTAIGLFHEAGFDFAAFNRIIEDYPGHFPVFVDGWTGRGVVAHELKRSYQQWMQKFGNTDLPKEALFASLVDPGHYGDVWGTDKDLFVPSAHFTAPEALGFSRAFIKDPEKIWSAYKFPAEYFARNLMDAWFDVFKAPKAGYIEEDGKPQDLSVLLAEIASLTDTKPEQWKVNINEVVRTFVNRKPKELILGVTEAEVKSTLPSLHYLASTNCVPVKYLPDLRTKYSCFAAVRIK